jgi:hypothetical protein
VEHVGDPAASLEEDRSVVVPGGTLYVFELPNRASYLEAIARRTGPCYHGRANTTVSTTAVPRSTYCAATISTFASFDVREFRRMNMLLLGLAARAALPIWTANRMLSALPGLNLVATNLELVARAGPHSSAPPSRVSAAARDSPR